MMADSNKKAREHEREITLAEEDFRHDEEEFDSVAGEEDPGAEAGTAGPDENGEDQVR